MAAPIVDVPAKISGDKITLTNWTTHLQGNINFLIDKGGDLASATTLPDFTAHYHNVTGTTTIRNFASANAKTGQPVRLKFGTALTIEDTGGGVGNIRVGGSNINVRANEMCDFVYDGSAWWLIARSFPPLALITAIAYHNTDVSIADGTETAVACNAEDKDTDGFHDTASNNSRLTVPTGLGGTYQVYARIPWKNSPLWNQATRQQALTVRKNGTTRLAESIAPTGSTNTGHDALMTVNQVWWEGDLIAGDYIEALVWQNDGGTRTLGGRTGDPITGPTFVIRKVG